MLPFERDIVKPMAKVNIVWLYKIKEMLILITGSVIS